MAEAVDDRPVHPGGVTGYEILSSRSLKNRIGNAVISYPVWPVSE